MTSLEKPNILNNIEEIKNKINTATKEANRLAKDVSLVTVSKTHDVETITEALEIGCRVFGENRVQEAQSKWIELRSKFPDVELHLIGPLQTNKIKEAVALFDVIETLDRPKLAAKLAQEMDKTGRCPDCYIQINTGEEPQKAGISPALADEFIKTCREEYKLPIKGLMCIPPVDEPSSPHFALLREIAKRNNISVLSMGMSADFETAVHLGATHVRVGSAIFGQRKKALPSF